MSASPRASPLFRSGYRRQLPSRKSVRSRAMPRALRLTFVRADLAMLEAAIESSGALSVALGGCAIAEDGR